MFRQAEPIFRLYREWIIMTPDSEKTTMNPNGTFAGSPVIQMPSRRLVNNHDTGKMELKPYEPEEVLFFSTKYEVTKGKKGFKEDHEVKFSTKLNMANGKWITTLTIDDKEFPAVSHAPSLMAINEERDKDCFNTKIVNMLNVTTKASQKIMYDINEEAQKQSDKFEALERIYEKKRIEEDNLRASNEAHEQALHEMKPKATVQSCFVPLNYEISDDNYYGICGATLFHTVNAQGEPVTHKLCDSKLMMTGYLKNFDAGTDLIELQFTAPDTSSRTAEWRTIWVSLEAITTKEGFRREIIPKGLAVVPKKLDYVIDYLGACKTANFGNTDVDCAFKDGSVFESNGWKDSDYTKFISGERYFRLDGKTVTESKCIFTDTENTEAGRKLATVGNRDYWVKSVSPLIKYPRIRFACFKTFDIMIAKMLGVDPCTIGFTKKSSTGKTLTEMLASSHIGDPNKRTGLIITGDISITALHASMRAYCDHTLFVDETTNMKEEVKKVIGYIATNGQEPERGRKDGKLRGQKPLNSNVIVNSEDIIISDRAMDGADNRAIIIEEAPMPELEQKLIRDVRKGILNNYGHILKLFLEKLAIHRDELPNWFEEAVTRLQATTENIGKKRQAEYYALAEVSGKLLEEVYSEIGIEAVNPTDIINAMWIECVLNRNAKPLAVKALESVYNYYTSHPRNFVSGDTLPTDTTITIDGWDFEEYTDWNQNSVEKVLKEGQFDKIKPIKEGWRDSKITYTNNSDTYVKSTSHWKRAGDPKRTSMAVIRMKKGKVYEFLPDIISPNTKEEKELDDYLDEIRKNAVS